MKDATAIGVAVLTAVAFVLFKLLRARQLSSPDPYNNPFTPASTGCLFAFLVLWLTTAVIAFAFSRGLTRGAIFLSLAVTVLGGMWVAYFLVGMLKMLHP
jgi:hypothetical protein